MRRNVIAALLLAAVTGCGDEPRRAAQEYVPERPLRVDTGKGTFRGMRMFDSEKRVRARFGAASCKSTSPMQPLGEDYYDIGGPTAFVPPKPRGGHGRDCFMRYRRLVVLMFARGVYGFATTDPRAETELGVGPGDPRALVTERYPGALCYTANEGTEWSTFPLCKVRLEAGKWLYFGGDPLKSLWLMLGTDG